MTDEEPRDRMLRGIAETYAGYEGSGYSRRWDGANPGYRLAIRERDAFVLEALEPYLDGAIADLGCGTGTLGQLLDASGTRPRRLYGCDVLENRLAVARELVPWATFEAASADRLPLQDGELDAAVAMTLLSSLPEHAFRRAVAAEVRRVLRPGGALILYDLRYPSPRNRAVRPVTLPDLRSLFPGWDVRARTLTVLPPLSRSRLAGGSRRYRALAAIPFLRSHVGAVLEKPR